MSATQHLSFNRLIAELRPLIDILRDPFSPARQPLQYAEAHRDLVLAVTNDDIWQQIFEIQPGCRTNNLLHTLGTERMEWLRGFRDQAVARRDELSA